MISISRTTAEIGNRFLMQPDTSTNHPFYFSFKSYRLKIVFYNLKAKTFLHHISPRNKNGKLVSFQKERREKRLMGGSGRVLTEARP